MPLVHPRRSIRHLGYLVSVFGPDISFLWNCAIAFEVHSLTLSTQSHPSCSNWQSSGDHSSSCLHLSGIGQLSALFLQPK